MERVVFLASHGTGVDAYEEAIFADADVGGRAECGAVVESAARELFVEGVLLNERGAFLAQRGHVESGLGGFVLRPDATTAVAKHAVLLAVDATGDSEASINRIEFGDEVLELRVVDDQDFLEGDVFQHESLAAVEPLGGGDRSLDIAHASEDRLILHTMLEEEGEIVAIDLDLPACAGTLERRVEVDGAWVAEKLDAAAFGFDPVLLPLPWVGRRGQEASGCGGESRPIHRASGAVEIAE